MDCVGKLVIDCVVNPLATFIDDDIVCDVSIHLETGVDAKTVNKIVTKIKVDRIEDVTDEVEPDVDSHVDNADDDDDDATMKLGKR